MEAVTTYKADRLAELAASLGEPVASAGNRPIGLDDPQTAWFVEQGGLDVFLVEYRDGQPMSSLKHLTRAGEGRLVFGVRESGEPLGVIAKALQGSRIRRLRLEVLLNNDIGDALADQVDAWVSEFAATVARQIEPRPRAGLLVNPREPRETEAGGVLSARPGSVVWFEGGGGAAYLGTEEPDEDGSGLIPLTSETWLTLRSPAPVTGVSSRDLRADGRLLRALEEFHRLALGAEQLNRLLLVADEANEQTTRTAHRRRDEEDARQSLFSILGSSRAVGQQSGPALFAALELVGGHESIAFHSPPPSRTKASEDFNLRDFLNASGVRARKVRLTPDDRWWLGDSGAMLGFLREDGRPVALLPSVIGRYLVVDPVTGRSARLDANRARDLDENAWFFYRLLPDDGPVSGKDLIGFAVTNMKVDWGRFAVAGFLASVLTLAPAILVGALVGWALPAGAGGALVQIAAALAASAIIGTLLLMLQGMALMRLEGRAVARAEAAICDRLLRLPLGFFRRYTAGELAVQMSVFRTLRDQVSGVVAGALLGIIFLLPSLGLLFLYDAVLAWATLAIGFLALAITALLGILQIAPQRRRYAAARGLAGELFQFINGMGKLRSAGAEGSALAAWARGYREQLSARRQIDDLNKHLVAFSAAVPALAGGGLFAVASWEGLDQLAVGDFLVVYLASMVFYTAVVGLGRAFEVLAAVAPAYEQVEPMLSVLPSGESTVPTQVELSGEVHLHRVSFRYSEEGPLILDNVSIDARPGEFIAIVGESGSGKSTLMRLALGLEEPTGGAVYYDGRDLANLTGARYGGKSGLRYKMARCSRATY